MFHTKADLLAITPEQLARLTPSQIDAYFSDLYDREFDQAEAEERAWHILYFRAGITEKRDRNGRSRGWEISRTELEELVTTTLAHGEDAGTRIVEGLRANRRSAYRWFTDLTDAYAGLLRARADEAALSVPRLVLGAEEVRRGGWNRAYLVQGPGGHVHNTQRCSSCHKGQEPTRFTWKIDYSGQSEDEIVAAAGERACTICYESAPTDALKRPTKMFGPDEIRRQKAAEERAAKAAVKAAKKAKNAISLPDGTPLHEKLDRNGNQTGSRVETIYAARQRLTSEAWYEIASDRFSAEHTANLLHIARAVAWKVNELPIGQEPTTEQIAAVIEPVRKRQRKELDKARAQR
jgi:hypothetical protein